MADKKKNIPVKAEKKYIELLYMTPQMLEAKDIADLFRSNLELTVELWNEMSVIELVLNNQNSVDLEAIDADFKSPSDAAFVKNRAIKTIYAISLNEADLPVVTSYFEQLVTKYSGFVCADSEDFTPVYAGSSKR